MKNILLNRPARHATAIAFGLILMQPMAAHAAGGVIGTGTPASCTETTFDTVFFNAQATGGGTITFNCGPTPHIIGFGTYKQVATNTEVRGAGLITLSGGNATQLFQVFAKAALTIDGLTLTRGAGTYGAIENLGRLTVRNSRLATNVATDTGGAILNHGELSITDTSIADNSAGKNGGGLYTDGGTATITRVQFLNNMAVDGGGAISAAVGSTVMVSSAEFSANKTTAATVPRINGGGAIQNSGALTITDSVLRQNRSQLGGAIDSHGGTAYVTRTVIVGNVAPAANGVWNQAAALTMLDVTLSGNGFEADGTPSVTASEGGAITVFGGTASLNNVTISGNHANSGAGIATHGGTTSLTNATISANQGMRGGAIYHESGTTLLTNVTVAGNTTSLTAFGAIYVGIGTVTLKNTLLANPDRNCGPNPPLGSFNFSTDATCGFGAGRDNALLPLGPLANNGGFTFTQVPLPGSAAIDNGTNAGCSPKDQRGVIRPSGLACDAGAVESVLGVLAVTTAVEYFHAGFGHYFVTYLTDEIAKLDAGILAGWVRTGDRFNVYQTPGADRVAVCRFFTVAFPPKSSHFYAPRGLGCEGTLQNSNWQFEGDVFYTPLPLANGDCPNGHKPIYRLYNNGQGGAPNHRFTTDPDVRTQMLALGYIAEGAGIGIGMCSPL